MIHAGLLIALIASASPTSGRSASDAVTLQDGKVALGQLLEADRRGPLTMLIRRAWAEANLPEKAAAWAKAEAPQVRKAESQRRERLLAWRRERRPDPAGGDRITPWIDRELARLADPAGVAKSPLMVVRLGRAEVKGVARGSRKDARMLRLGWLSHLPDVEAMPLGELTQALEGRGFSADADTPVSVESLLPAQPEADARWLARRAATEVLHDPGARLIRHQGLVLPEPAAGEAPPAAASLDAALGTLKGLLGGEEPVDPLPGKLRDLAGQGRVGVVVTRLDLAADLASVAVEATLWARAGDRWAPVASRSATSRPDDLPADAGAALADDPQVKAAFGLVEAFGLGELPPGLKRRTLGMGAATRQALGRAKAALDQDLQALALSMEAPSATRP